MGGKNASLGEMIRALSPPGGQGARGFATTSEAYWYFLEHNSLKEAIAQELSGLDVKNPTTPQRASGRLRNLILKGEYPEDLREEILLAYRRLSEEAGEEEEEDFQGEALRGDGMDAAGKEVVEHAAHRLHHPSPEDGQGQDGAGGHLGLGVIPVAHDLEGIVYDAEGRYCLLQHGGHYSSLTPEPRARVRWQLGLR